MKGASWADGIYPQPTPSVQELAEKIRHYLDGYGFLKFKHIGEQNVVMDYLASLISEYVAGYKADVKRAFVEVGAAGADAILKLEAEAASLREENEARCAAIIKVQEHHKYEMDKRIEAEAELSQLRARVRE